MKDLFVTKGRLNELGRKGTSIITLGTRGNIPEQRPHYAKHSGLLIDSTILLDLGEKDFLKCNPQAIFITHLHSDHACFVEEDLGQIECPVYAPCPFEKGLKCACSKDRCGLMNLESYQFPPSTATKSLRRGILWKAKGREFFIPEILWR